MIPEDFDGLKSRTVFCLWTGPELMSEARLQAIWSIFSNTACPVAFVNRGTVSEWVRPGHPLHPAYEHLSSVHKSDYLRCYLMHHFGGGYTDIKHTSKQWNVFFDLIEASDKDALGYVELPHGIPHVTGEHGDRIRAAHAELIGLCAFIFRPRTELTRLWLERTETLLDEKLPALKTFPARHPMDQTGVILPDGRKSDYPLRWAELLGEIFHPLIYERRDRLMQAPIEPRFSNYR
jgi:hypothetical protein